MRLPPHAQDEPPAAPARSREANALQLGLVRLIREASGKGPATITVVQFDGQVVITATGCLTRAERRLRDSGHRDVAIAIRRALQDHIDKDVLTTVRLDDQPVAAAVSSAVDVDAERVVTVIALHPEHENVPASSITPVDETRNAV